MNEIKVGDLVICVDSELSDRRLIEGNIYEVVKLSTYNDILQVKGCPVRWRIDRFIPVPRALVSLSSTEITEACNILDI